MKKLFAIALLGLVLTGCAGIPKGEVCQMEGGERNQHEVCHKK